MGNERAGALTCLWAFWAQSIRLQPFRCKKKIPQASPYLRNLQQVTGNAASVADKYSTASTSVCQLVSLSVRQSVSSSVGQSVSPSVFQSASESVPQYTSVNQWQSISVHSVNESTERTDKPTDPKNRPTDRSTDRPSDRPTNSRAVAVAPEMPYYRGNAPAQGAAHPHR